MVKEYPMYLSGRWDTSDQNVNVANPYNDEVIGTTYGAIGDQVEPKLIVLDHT